MTDHPNRTEMDEREADTQRLLAGMALALQTAQFALQGVEGRSNSLEAALSSVLIMLDMEAAHWRKYPDAILALSKAPAPQRSGVQTVDAQPTPYVAWIAFAENGNIRFWTNDYNRSLEERRRGLDLRAFTLAELVALVGNPRAALAPVTATGRDDEGANEPEAIAKLREFDRLGLVIESAVRNADAPNWPCVTDLIKRTRVFMSILGPAPASSLVPSADRQREG